MAVGSLFELIFRLLDDFLGRGALRGIGRGFENTELDFFTIFSLLMGGLYLIYALFLTYRNATKKNYLKNCVVGLVSTLFIYGIGVYAESSIGVLCLMSGVSLAYIMYYIEARSTLGAVFILPLGFAAGFVGFAVTIGISVGVLGYNAPFGIVAVGSIYTGAFFTELESQTQSTKRRGVQRTSANQQESGYAKMKTQCPNCGRKWEVFCSNCRTPIGPLENRCSNCGKLSGFSCQSCGYRIKN